jgi:hypothetical protein
MPIPPDILERALIPRVLTPATTVAELLYLLAEQPEPHRCYAVLRVAADAYDVLALDDLRELAEARGAALLPLPLGALVGLLRPAAPLYQARIGQAAAERKMHATPRRRIVVLDADGEVAGVMVTNPLAVPKGGSPLGLIGATPGVLEQGATMPAAPPQLNTRFDGVAPNAPLIVGQRVPLIVSVGTPTATHSAQSSAPFLFDFAGAAEPVRFTVHVDADPEMWTVQVVTPTMIVAPPGATTQEAKFTIIARRPGGDKLHLSVERDGATIQHVWLPVVAALDQAAPLATPAARLRVEAALPLDVTGAERPAVELTIQPGLESSVVIVRADLPGNTVRETCRIPVGGAAIQNATLRLRKELEQIVFYRAALGDGYAFVEGLTIDPATARRACVSLADAGQQVWDMLFNAPRADDRLKQLAADLRVLPHGSRLSVVLDSHECIVPWALLYDQPGPIDEQTLAWDGFWGYRYNLDVFPPGRYPAPAIGDAPPGLLLLLNDDEKLRQFTGAQEQFVRQTLGGARIEVAWGDGQVQQMLRTPPDTTLIYCYCHGDHKSGAVAVGALASESAIYFSGQQGIRIADLRRLPAGPLASHPLVFLNACSGATQDAFYYDGFMPFFIEQQGARGFIGTEVRAPQILAHEFALQFLRMFGAGQPVGAILWRLRQHYLQEHNNILAFNYSLYCSGDVRLAEPLLVGEGDKMTR